MFSRSERGRGKSCEAKCTEDTEDIHSVDPPSTISTAVESRRIAMMMIMFDFARRPNETSGSGWCPRDNIATLEQSLQHSKRLDLSRCPSHKHTHRRLADWSENTSLAPASMWLNWHYVYSNAFSFYSVNLTAHKFCAVTGNIVLTVAIQ